jgi:hypothetical protein
MTTETTNYIPHSQIARIRAAQRMEHAGTMFIELTNGQQYQTEDSFTTDANGITGNFTGRVNAKLVEPPKTVIKATLIDLFRDGGTALYLAPDGKEYYVWRPTGAVYADSKHSKHIPDVRIQDLLNPGYTDKWTGAHSPYHRVELGTGFEPGSPNDEAARLAAHG